MSEMLTYTQRNFYSLISLLLGGIATGLLLGSLGWMPTLGIWLFFFANNGSLRISRDNERRNK